VTQHEVLVGFRLRLFTLAEELGSVSAAYRANGGGSSTYTALKAKVDRGGLEALLANVCAGLRLHGVVGLSRHQSSLRDER
jgi:hypothetical protein